ncbi:MAG: M48 family metalloprotease [Deltaproteobacteria bacterium]|nr:M48 family metalloprotease [Deltaproteobacteria bacterium]
MKKQMLTLATACVALGLVGRAEAINLGSVSDVTRVARDVKDVAKSLAINDQKEMEIGASTHPQIVAQMGGEVHNPKLQQYVERVGQRLAAKSDRTSIPYHFTVLNTDDFNAFALPGGYVYVTKGLLSAIRDESELAVVLGHEITHVSHKHGIKQLQTALVAKKGMGYATEAAAGAVAREAGGTAAWLAGEAMNKVMGVLMNFALQGYGREQELDADKWGIRFANDSGYDPNGAVRMFEHLVKLEGGAKPKGLNALLASHPDSAKRLEVAKAEVATLSPPLGKMTNKPQYIGMVKALK